MLSGGGVDGEVAPCASSSYTVKSYGLQSRLHAVFLDYRTHLHIQCPHYNTYVL